jgi:tRNA pseudouridine55 synthase
LHGLLVVDKPGLGGTNEDLEGTARLSVGANIAHERLLTSHDVVNRVRRWSGQRRIGHTGTLDPMAGGVLLLCLGKATRLAEYYQGERKAYEAEILLGLETDTYDVVGTTVAVAPVPILSLEQIHRALAQFLGTVPQRPPAFSAIKQGGEALYHKARRGESVTVETRQVTFYALTVLAFTPPERLRLHVECSAGAYVRSLAHDLGVAFGTCGCLAALRRTAVGAIPVTEASPLAAIESAAHNGQLDELLKPVGWRLPLPTVRLSTDLLRPLGFGQTIILSDEDAGSQQELAQGIDEQGACVGVLRRIGPARGESQGSHWKAEKWLL